jgi:microcystin degradation protein MlrC
MRIAQEVENGAHGLSAGIFIGNPFTDVPALQTYCFVVTDDDPALAEREAIHIAGSFWANHEKMQVPLVSLDQMAQLAGTHTQGTIAFVDAADATSSGASGDSDEITAGGWKLDADGMLAIPITPGLGLELDPDAVRKYTGGEKLL